jgi:hypothetical protein
MNPKPIGRPILNASQVVAFTGTPGVSTAMPRGVTCVRLIASADCFVSITPNGAAPTAAADMLIKANDRPEYFACSVGDKISAIQSSTGGNLYITPIDQSGN